MNSLVFTTFDITPEQWSEFGKSVAIPSDITDDKPIIPHILIHSPSQSNLDSETETIDAPVTTEFASTAWLDLRQPFITMSSENIRRVHPTFFLILDEQSMENRKVTLVHKTGHFVNEEGKRQSPGYEDHLLTKVVVWKRYHVPFEQTFVSWAAVANGGLDDEDDESPYLEEVVEEAGES